MAGRRSRRRCRLSKGAGKRPTAMSIATLGSEAVRHQKCPPCPYICSRISATCKRAGVARVGGRDVHVLDHRKDPSSPMVCP
jgi:hypothetical protein